MLWRACGLFLYVIFALESEIERRRNAWRACGLFLSVASARQSVRLVVMLWRACVYFCDLTVPDPGLADIEV